MFTLLLFLLPMCYALFSQDVMSMYRELIRK